MSAASISRQVAARIRLLILDVDGVLTDGGIYLGAGPAGERIELKRFEITDGLGIRLMREAGILVAIVTGRESAAVALRAEELGITECHQDRGARKLGIVEGLMKKYQLDWEEVACLGDDLPDLPVLARAGLAAVVANGSPEVRAVAHWVGSRTGGYGAAREFAQALLEARGEWTERVDAYVRERSQ